ncbi:MAG: ABC transporter permease [Parcubacteria group bacterium]
MKFKLFSKKEGIMGKGVRGEDINYTIGEKPKETWKEKHMGISLSMILYISLKNLKVSRTRSVLTIGGVALGIAIITFLLSMGFGVQRMIVDEVTKDNPINVIDVSNGNLDNFVFLNGESVDKIKNIDGVEKIERRVNGGGKIILGESQTDVVIYGTTVDYLDMARINYRQNGGKFFNEENNVLISDRLASLLGFQNSYDAIGKTITYNIMITKDINSKAGEDSVAENNEISISGVISGTDNAYIYIPFKTLEDKFGINSAQEGKVAISDMAKFDNVKAQLEQMGFLTDSVNDLLVDINNFFNTVRIIMVIFGIIIMSISVMGMLNTLSVSLLQRTKEIGILKALGTKRIDVFKMFVLESMIISFMGGVIGFFAGCGFAFLVNKVMIVMGSRMGVSLAYFVFIPSSFIISIACFIVFLGIITGIMPAFRAAKIHALEALRYE